MKKAEPTQSELARQLSYISEIRAENDAFEQVNGRKNVEWNRRIELNVWYIDHLSLWLDIKIFFMTIFKVLRNEENENVGKTVAEKNVTDEKVEEKEVLKK